MTAGAPDPGLGPGGEFDLIRSCLEADVPVAGRGSGGVGPGDDAAFLADEGLVISTDLSVEGVHFRRDWLSMRELGRRVTVVALSDLAAMAAVPTGVLLSLAVPERDRPHLHSFYDGVGDALREVGGALYGGDLSRSHGPLLVDVVALGRAEDPVLRQGAVPGDEIWVSGALGGAAGVLRMLLADTVPDDADLRAWVRPEARVDGALWLARHARPNAMIDLSDGLAGDVGHIAAASAVAVVLDLSSVPLARGGADAAGGLDDALQGGEDYELCFAASPGLVDPIATRFEAELGYPLTRVGWVEDGEGVWAAEHSGAEPVRLERGGFSHWEDAGP